MREAIDAGTRSIGKRKLVGGDSSRDEGESYYDKVLTQRLNLWKINPGGKRQHLMAPTVTYRA